MSDKHNSKEMFINLFQIFSVRKYEKPFILFLRFYILLKYFGEIL